MERGLKDDAAALYELARHKKISLERRHQAEMRALTKLNGTMKAGTLACTASSHERKTSRFAIA
jgi:DNA-directed RNA polymerase sigma subunit (sigma70/sigma32)